MNEIFDWAWGFELRKKVLKKVRVDLRLLRSTERRPTPTLFFLNCRLVLFLCLPNSSSILR
jgi:hypothetical protein